MTSILSEYLISQTKSHRNMLISNCSVGVDCRWTDQKIVYSGISPKIMITYCQITCTIP